MSDRVFKVGDTGLTSTNETYRVIAVDRKHPTHKVCVFVGDEETTTCVTETGHLTSFGQLTGAEPFLLSPKQRLECWVNFYQEYKEPLVVYCFDTQEEAREDAEHRLETFLKTVHFFTEV